MLRHDHNRADPKRRHVVDHRKQQFAEPAFKQSTYPSRLNFYRDPPTADITLEEFEQWAIDRLKVLAELEACSFRNKPPQETSAHMRPILEKYLPLQSSTSASDKLQDQRRKDHYSHFILRLAFASTEDLRRRFCRLETMLFRLRFADENLAERSDFVKSLRFEWFDDVSREEKEEIREELRATLGWERRGADVVEEDWVKMDWMRVPDLVESRKVFLRAGKAYVPGGEQTSMIVAEFSSYLEKQLENTANARTDLDEGDRLTPILDHLSKNFIAPDSSYLSGSSTVSGADISASNIDTLSTAHFPACMQHLHRTLRRDAHLKHYGRLQYSLFLKGIGLTLDECLIFWRSSFSKITDDTFNKEYKYNVRHVYGDVGGDGNRRTGGYAPYSCQKILMEHAPGTGEAHGCPYRHFDVDNLITLVQSMGVEDRGVLQGIKDDKAAMKYHIACNRVFEHVHKNEIKRAKQESIMTGAQLETIVHPNEYFKRSYLLKNLDKRAESGDVKMEE